MKLKLAAVLLLSATPALAHRLDEYLQGTLLSVGKTRLEGQITLTPGVAIFPVVLAAIDANGDGIISEAEQRAYAGRVLGDLALAVDGKRLTPRLSSMRFPAIDELKDGRGEIQLEFDAGLPRGGAHRRLTLENRHFSRIAAYQVNALVPRDPDIRITAQNRNYLQSMYRLDFEQAGVRPQWAGDGIWLGAVGVLLLTRFGFLRVRNGTRMRQALEE